MPKKKDCTRKAIESAKINSKMENIQLSKEKWKIIKKAVEEGKSVDWVVKKSEKESKNR